MGIFSPIKRNGRVSGKRKPSFLFSLFQNLFDFVYPPICLLCDARHDSRDPLCPRCIEQLHASLLVKSQSESGDFRRLSTPLFFDRAVTCWDFIPEIENLIHQVKYQGRKRLGFFLGKMAGQAMTDGFEKLVKNGIFIPVPLHGVRLREREFNQSEWIAKGLAESVCGEVRPQILARKKKTRTQTALSAEEREKNVKNAFRVRWPEWIRGRQVVLVDDVITTGATLNACAKVLKEAGAKSIVGFALARPKMVLASEIR